MHNRRQITQIRNILLCLYKSSDNRNQSAIKQQLLNLYNELLQRNNNNNPRIRAYLNEMTNGKDLRKNQLIDLYNYCRKQVDGELKPLTRNEKRSKDLIYQRMDENYDIILLCLDQLEFVPE